MNNIHIHTSNAVPQGTFLLLPSQGSQNSGQVLVTTNSGSLQWANVPSFTFQNDSNTGFYFSAPNTIGVAISEPELLTSFFLKDIHTDRVYHAENVKVSHGTDKSVHITIDKLHLPLVFYPYFASAAYTNPFSVGNEMRPIHILLLKLEIPIKQGKTPGGSFETHFIQITSAQEITRTKKELIVTNVSARSITDNFDLLKFIQTDKILREALKEAK